MKWPTTVKQAQVLVATLAVPVKSPQHLLAANGDKQSGDMTQVTSYLDSVGAGRRKSPGCSVRYVAMFSAMNPSN